MRIPLLLHGATGRMGRAVRACLAEAPEVALVACAAPDRDDGPCPGDCAWLSPEDLAGPAGLAALPPDLVVLDVSLAPGTERLVGLLERAPRALVAATTGLSSGTEERIRVLGTRTAVLRATNLSVGVASLLAMLGALPAAARAAFDADVVEHHHAMKKDAPSGTALSIAAALSPGAPDRVRFAAPASSPREPGDVRIHSIRSGAAPGTHRVLLAGAGETLEVTHIAHDRAIFARGALRAVRFVHGREPGVYSFLDALHSN